MTSHAQRRPSIVPDDKAVPHLHAIPGQFVEWIDNHLGVGKIVEMGSSLAQVEYFDSPASDETFRCDIALSSLRAVQLATQSRVYFKDPGTLLWRVGRVLDYQADDRKYLIRFPNKDTRLIQESTLVTRWSQPIKDPTDHLALQLNETPFWHQGRSAFVHNLYSQRRACGGMPGLLSSAIDLVAHQVTVVRRVLQDPFQRYVLADEVGLGKTVEAGILIRQYVLDELELHRVLVIVPEALIQQWKQELRRRFHLEDQLGSTVHVIAHRDATGIKQFGKDAGMVVIDEAHHLSAWAHSKDAGLAALFRAVANITSPSERRVLLLSATPVLHNESAFLAMLHLIDPLLYSLDDIEAFRQRVRHRQEVAESMVSLTEDESNFFLGQTLAELSEFFPDDIRFHRLQQSLSQLVERDVSEEDAERCSLIRALRTHISETWRLHRRLLRNRRTKNTEFLLPGRGGSEKRVWESPAVETLEELLNEWRLSAAQYLYDRVDPADGEPTTRLLARVLAEAAASDPHVLAAIIDERLSASDGTIERLRLFDREFDALHDAPFFEGERELLQQICQVANDFDDVPRLRCLEALIVALDRSNDDRAAAVVVFTNYPQTADRVFAFLGKRLGTERVLRHHPERSGWTRFLGTSDGLVLVCDRRAEEGLNLQNRRSVAIHFDLPFSANRIEQRLGRLDRFGTGRRIPSFALVASGSATQTAWFRCLDEALQVFDRSIASLQYVIEEEFQQVWSEFPDAGVDAFSDAIARLGGSEGTIETEFRRIRAQDELDAFERDPVAEKGFVEKLEGFDLKASRFRQSLEQWLVDRLHFRSSGEEGPGDSVVQYQFCRRDDCRPRRGEKDTLMSCRDFLRRFSASLDDAGDLRRPVVAETKLVSFDRQVAQRRETRLARIGDPLIDAIEKYVRWDDRGICFAMWRYRPNVGIDGPAEISFRFDLVAEADQTPLRRLLDDWPEASLAALRRRADMAFPPLVDHLWLDSELELVTDAGQLRILNEPYRDEPVRNQPIAGQDCNLNQDRWKKANEICDITVWRGLCYAAREKAESFLREQSKMPELVRECSEKAATSAARRIEQFESRLARITSDGAATLHRELEFERAFADAIQKAIRSPSVRVDSIGAVFLSPHNPFADESLAEDDD